MISYSVHGLADEIFGNEFEYDSGYAQFYYIYGWLANNIGSLNTKIYSNYEVVSGNFEPSGDFRQEERAIYRQMYLHEFYIKKTRSVLRGVDSSVLQNEQQREPYTPHVIPLRPFPYARILIHRYTQAALQFFLPLRHCPPDVF